MLQVDAENDWWDEANDELKASVERGLKDVRAGRITPHAEVMEKYQEYK